MTSKKAYTPTNRNVRKVVRVRFTMEQMSAAIDKYPGHRDFVLELFKEKGFVVINWSKIQFFWGKTVCVVEGTANEGLLSV